ncbi:MAG TPA: tryptophan-rich sensory protein [Chlamydiales bacterium]|nr:tryptophan-rich sensory protein [Chlamydiales bacterium]
MSIDHSQPDSLQLPGFRILRQSHRTRPEQIVGLGIFLLISLGFQLIGGLSTQFYDILPSRLYAALCLTYSLSLAFGMWTLWRCYSLRLLKLELSVFLGQFLFQMVWSLSFFALHEMLLALVALLLLWSNTLLSLLLFWKKEKLSGGLFLFPLLWIFYLVGLNMVICISKP